MLTVDIIGAGGTSCQRLEAVARKAGSGSLPTRAPSAAAQGSLT